MSRIVCWLIAGFVLVTLSGCGGGSGGDEGGTPPTDNFSTFKSYAQNNGASNSPSVQDYIDAGVTGVTEDNLDEVNAAVAVLNPNDVDTAQELQHIADRFGLNVAPTANAGDDQTITEGSNATLTCVGSDIDNDTLSYRWLNGAIELSTDAHYTTASNLSVGVHTYTCEVNDGTSTATDFVNVTVNAQANLAPVADINATPTAAIYGATISFDASGSHDNDGSIQSYRWSEGATTLSTSINFVKDDLGLGTHTITLTVTDDESATSSASINIVIQASNQLKKTGQTKSFDLNGNEVMDGRIKDDGYYQKGVTSSYTRDDTTNIVTDHITGLQWQDDSAANTVQKPWITIENYKKCLGIDGYDRNVSSCNDTSGDTAVAYCASLSLAGKGWRLPTVEELVYIVDRSKKEPALDNTFQNIISDFYWSSTKALRFEHVAWYVNFQTGHIYWDNKAYDLYIRCIRKK